jgi:hypothetical protein
MPGFTTRELRLLANEQEQWLPELVTIERRTLTDDTFGGVTSGARTVVQSNVPARVTQAQVFDLGGQLARGLDIEQWTVRVPLGTNIQDEDYVVWGAKGITIQIKDIKDRTHATVISCKGEKVK